MAKKQKPNAFKADERMHVEKMLTWSQQKKIFRVVGQFMAPDWRYWGAAYAAGLSEALLSALFPRASVGAVTALLQRDSTAAGLWTSVLGVLFCGQYIACTAERIFFQEATSQFTYRVKRDVVQQVPMQQPLLSIMLSLMRRPRGNTVALCVHVVDIV